MENFNHEVVTISIFNSDESEKMKVVLLLREEIFVKGQNVPLERDVDGDDDKCNHVLMYYNSEPIGVMRLYSLGNDKMKLQRVGVLSKYRGLKLGEKMMKFVLDELIKSGVKAFILGSQCTVIGFYEKLGFKVYGDVYIDAGIEHKDMILEL